MSRMAGKTIRARRCRERSMPGSYGRTPFRRMHRSSRPPDPVVRFQQATQTQLNLLAGATICRGEAPIPGVAGVPPMRTRLVELAREGDDVAFSELVDLDGDMCYGIAFRI